MHYVIRQYKYDSDYISCKDFSFLRLAGKTALLSQHHNFRLGAVVVKSGRVLSQGVNVKGRTQYTPPRRESIHAEVNALRGLSDCEGTTVYVARLDAFDRLALAKPCEHCVEHMLENGVKRVVFSISENDADSFSVSSVEWGRLVSKRSVS